MKGLEMTIIITVLGWIMFITIMAFGAFFVFGTPVECVDALDIMPRSKTERNAE